MAKEYNKYHAASPETNKDTRKKTTISPGNTEDNLKAHVFDDGTIEAENFVERDSNKLSLEITEKGEKYYFSKDLDKNTKEEYVSTAINKQYRTNISRDFEVKNAFAVYRSEVKSFLLTSLPRYTSLPKGHKREIDAIRKNKNEYIFTDNRNGSLWNRVFIDSQMLGPYNYDTKLIVSKEINFISDLLVVRTGNQHQSLYKKGNKFVNVPSGNTIVYVSPHETLNYSGKGSYVSSGYSYTSTAMETGASFSGNSFLTKNFGVLNNTGCFALSSKFVKILTDTQLKTEHGYKMDLGGELKSFNNTRTLAETPFYYVLTEYQNKLHKQGFEAWDGVIPSGSCFTIETWSTNPRYIGFDGEITIKPVDETVAADCSFSSTEVGQGVSINYQSSVRKAINNAKKKFHRKLNTYLMDKGIKYKNKKKIRYDKMLEKVAQNIYDGLTVVRNENISKVQGASFVDPENYPMYYDGTSKVYGGTLDNSNYDYLYTTVSRLYSGVDTTTSNTSSNSSLAGGNISSSSSSSTSSGY